MTESESERFVLRNARHLAADYVRRTVRPGDAVVDATMGNGGHAVSVRAGQGDGACLCV